MIFGYPKLKSLAAIIFLVIIGFFIFNSESVFSNDDYFEIKEMLLRRRPWPTINIRDNYTVYSDSWKTPPQHRYYSWLHGERTRGEVQIYTHGQGDIINEFGEVSRVSDATYLISEKNRTYTTADGQTIYYHVLDELNDAEIGELPTDEEECYVDWFELEFYDRRGVENAYESWVVNKFFNRSIELSNGQVVNFSGPDDTAVRTKLRQAANNEGEWAPYAWKYRDPDADGFWAPYGGYDPETNAPSGGGSGSSEVEPPEEGQCLKLWVDRLEGGGCVTGELNVESGGGTFEICSMDELYAWFKDGWYGYLNLVKWKCGESCPKGPGTPPDTWNGPESVDGIDNDGDTLIDEADEGWEYPLTDDNLNPTPASDTKVQVEPLLIDLIDNSDPPIQGCPLFDVLAGGEQFQTPVNNETFDYEIEWNMAFPVLRETIEINIGSIDPEPYAGYEAEADIVIEKLRVTSAAEGVIYSLRQPVTMDAKDFGIRIEKDANQLSTSSGCGNYFDLTNMKVEFTITNPWTDPTDPLDRKKRSITALTSVRTDGGPDKVPYNYYSRCGYRDPDTGEIDKVLCEHDFPHVKDDDEGGLLDKIIYITGNYLDENGDAIPEDIESGLTAFTNYEEFVWDTDPLIKNTSAKNNFSYSDEMFIAGVGQDRLLLSDAYKESFQQTNQILEVTAEGITSVPQPFRDSSHWITTVGTNEEPYIDYESLDVHLKAENNDKGGWSLPTVGQRARFTASIGTNGDLNAKDSSLYTWLFMYRPKDSEGLYTVITSHNNIRGLAQIDDFVIDRDGDYSVQVVVTDVDGKTGEDYFDFQVNGDFIIEHPFGISGDLMVVEANINSLGLDTNSPIVWKLDGNIIQQGTEPVVEFITEKEAGDSHRLELTGVSLAGDSREDSIKTKIEIPVVDPEVIISVPNMPAGTIGRGYFTPGQALDAVATFGPSGSTWDDPDKFIEVTWNAVGVSFQNSFAPTLSITPPDITSVQLVATAYSPGYDGDYNYATGNIFLVQENNVQGVFANFWQIMKDRLSFMVYTFSGLFIIIVMYLTAKKYYNLVPLTNKLQIKNKKNQRFDDT